MAKGNEVVDANQGRTKISSVKCDVDYKMEQKYATSTEKGTGINGHSCEEIIESTSTKIDMKDKNEQTYRKNDENEYITEKTYTMKQEVDEYTESNKIELSGKMEHVKEKTSTNDRARSSNLENKFELDSNSYETNSCSQVLDLSTHGKCSGSQQKRKSSEREEKNNENECITEKTYKYKKKLLLRFMEQEVDKNTESIKIEMIGKIEHVEEKTSIYERAKSSNLEKSFDQDSNSYETYSCSQVLDLSTHGKCSNSQQKRKGSDVQLDTYTYGKRPRLGPYSFVSSSCLQEGTNFYQGNSQFITMELKQQEQTASVPPILSPMRPRSAKLGIIIRYPDGSRYSIPILHAFEPTDQNLTQGPAGIPNPGIPNLPGQPLPPPPPVNDPPPAKT